MQAIIGHTTKLLKMRIVRVGIIGIIGLIVQTTLFEILGIWLEIVRPSTAAVIGGEVAILLNFTLNNRFSFGDRVGMTAPLPVRLARFHMVVAGSLFLQWLFVFLTERVTTDFYLIHLAYFCGVGLGFISNYMGYKLFVWKHHPPKKEIPIP